MSRPARKELNVPKLKLGNWKQQSNLGGIYGNAVQVSPTFLKSFSQPKQKGCLFHSHFLKKPISLFKKGYLTF